LLEALALLNKKNTNCVLWIVGDGPERPRLQELADKLDLTPSISFLGIRNKEEIADLMRQADVFALTSLWENQPVALIEALACGLPVIAPAIGGIPEIVRPENGLLFEPGNVDNLVEKLSEMISHLKDFSPEVSARYAHDSFGLQAIGNRLTDVYEQLLTKAH
jgi:glycosyltransferase involved in cell wall biosynthesis